MTIRVNKTAIPGCYELSPTVFKDKRGLFVKTFHQDIFSENGLETHFTEEYYTLSHRDVVRGLHFQVPPMDHVKLVYCVAGEVIDAVVDLRVGSPTYGQFEVFTLSAKKGNMVYIPRGLAHGFCVLSESAIMQYKVTTVYSPEYDSGILWNSAGIPWPCEAPVISERDRGFPALSGFSSPFKYMDSHDNK